jgi:hypothetical protein
MQLPPGIGVSIEHSPNIKNKINSPSTGQEGTRRQLSRLNAHPVADGGFLVQERIGYCDTYRLFLSHISINSARFSPSQNPAGS